MMRKVERFSDTPQCWNLWQDPMVCMCPRARHICTGTTLQGLAELPAGTSSFLWHGCAPGPGTSAWAQLLTGSSGYGVYIRRDNSYKVFGHTQHKAGMV